jgi:hypothetical protein
MSQFTNVGNIIGGDIAVRPSRNYRAFRLIERSATRALELLAEAQLPSEMREEIAANLSLMIDEARRQDSSGMGQALSQAHRAREYMIKVASHLEEDGSARDERVGIFVAALRVEERRLLEELTNLRG